MDQSRAVSALAPFIALAKSANSPQAAANLVTQATSAPNTYVFAELLQQPNVQALAANEQYKAYHQLLQGFAWGTWESVKATPGLPSLSDAQALKLRLLSLLTIASEKPSLPTTKSNLSYATLCARLELSSPIDLEHLVTEAIYQNLITATLNPAAQTVIITSVAPLRDLAPGSVPVLINELAAWSSRCNSALADLEGEIRRVKADAEKRAKREAFTERQIDAVMDGAGGKGALGAGRGGAPGKEVVEADDDADHMDVDGTAPTQGAARKKSAGGGGSNIFSKLARGANR